jgi:hypothetical protein
VNSDGETAAADRRSSTVTAKTQIGEACHISFTSVNSSSTEQQYVQTTTADNHKNASTEVSGNSSGQQQQILHSAMSDKNEKTLRSMNKDYVDYEDFVDYEEFFLDNDIDPRVYDSQQQTHLASSRHSNSNSQHAGHGRRVRRQNHRQVQAPDPRARV